MVPDEENRNKGMVYEDIYNALSDDERSTLGLTDEYVEQYQMNIKSQIENSRSGLISNSDLKEGLYSSTNTDEKRPKPNPNVDAFLKMDPYERKIYDEMRSAQRESDNFNQSINFVNSYRQTDDADDDYVSFDANLFNELNE